MALHLLTCIMFEHLVQQRECGSGWYLGWEGAWVELGIRGQAKRQLHGPPPFVIHIGHTAGVVPQTPAS